jgi:hypothetical protein
VSKDELVGAYIEGRISRRAFVRGLMVAGVSVAAAIAYSDTLLGSGPSVRVGQYGDEYYYGDQYYGGATGPGGATRVPAPTFTG